MSVSVKENFLEINGEPVFLFGGDVSYCRIARRHWKERMLQMKAAGLNTIAVYVIWCYHQPAPDIFDFSGERDLPYFLSLIKECGMYCIFRMGPFVHGEYSNGGLPQWLVDKLGTRARTNDPEYLAYAEAWYNKLLDLVTPFLNSNGGPVVLLQLENELGSAGCKGDDLPRGDANKEENKKHLLFYYDLVRKHGIDLPLLDINNIEGKDELLKPLVDTGGMYPTNCFCCDGELRGFSADWWKNHKRPKITIETGGGMFVRYFDTPAYRNTNGFQGPLVSPELIEATVVMHIAEGCSGVNLYIFCDGQNPDGCGEGMLPAKNMNYQAPISVVGRFRNSYWKLKRIGWFLRSFKNEILHSGTDEDWAKVRVCGIAHPGASDGGDLFENYGKMHSEELSQDEQLPVLARTTPGLNLSESNFIFLRNTFNAGAKWKRDIRILTSPSKLACEVWHEYPKKTQLEMPPGTMKIMPFFVRLRKGCFLEYSTAELLDKRDFNGKTQVVLCESDEVMSEIRLVLPETCSYRISGNFLALRESPNTITLIGRAERNPLLFENDQLRILLVSKEYAEHFWDIGKDMAWANALISGTEKEIVCSTESEDFCMEWLAQKQPYYSEGLSGVREEYDSERKLYRLNGKIDIPEVNLEWQKEFGSHGITMTTDISSDLGKNADDVILTVSYNGSSAQAFLNGRLVSDHAYGKFLPWEISLKDLEEPQGRLELVCHEALDCQISCACRVSRTIKFK